MKLYFYIKGKRIIEISTEEIENYVGIELADNFDEAMNVLNKEYELDKKIYDCIEEIYSETEDENKIEDEDNGYKIKHWVSNRSFGELIDMYDNDEITKPEMQRTFVWDSAKCSRLIESIVMGLPIPPLFLMEVEGKKGNTYEIIDGYQRLNTLYNFIKGNKWTYQKSAKDKIDDNNKIDDNTKKSSASKISKRSIISRIAGKTFCELDTKDINIIKRSTVPLIEFKQLKPDDFSSKFLIFERINTGSEKLSAMQIRKSLVYGKLIEGLYNIFNKDINCNYFKLFSDNEIKKDLHIEALLRIIVMTDIYKNVYEPKKSGINNILNEFCRENRDNNEKLDNCEKIFEIIDFLFEVFTPKEICRRVNKNGEYSGYLNVCILEALVGNFLFEFDKFDKSYTNIKKFKTEYENKIKESFCNNKNPFSVSTGTVTAIKRRFDICYNIIKRCK